MAELKQIRFNRSKSETMEIDYYTIHVFAKTRKEQWDDNDEMFYKYFEDSFTIDCDENDHEILMKLNNHSEDDEPISCLKIPNLIDAHLGHSMYLEWDDDDVLLLKTTVENVTYK